MKKLLERQLGDRRLMGVLCSNLLRVLLGQMRPPAGGSNLSSLISLFEGTQEVVWTYISGKLAYGPSTERCSDGAC